MRILGTVLAAAILAAPLMLAAQAGDAQRAENVAALIIYDKPYEHAETAYEAALECEAEQVTEYEETEPYTQPYAPTWYESDDEAANMDAKEWIAWRESGGDYEARNGQYIGKFQLSEDKLDGDYSPEHQEEVADAYVMERYGSWEAARDFWERNGWY